MAFSLALLGSTTVLSAQAKVSGAPAARRNVVVFVADGLRRGSVNAQETPAMFRVRSAGVDFQNSHAVFPTFTTANASVIATGHGLGDTGDFSNTVYPGVWLTKPDAPAAAGFVTPFLENDEVLANMNSVFDGNYLGERTLLSVAREHGFNVAAVGKLGPTAIQDGGAVRWENGVLTAEGGVIVDDSTGQSGGLPLSPEIVEAMEKAGLEAEAPLRSNGFAEGSRGNNGNAGDALLPGTDQANRVQEQWFADVATKVLLPRFAAEGKPFVLLFWSRDPDGTQHNQGDSLQRLTPGINGETSRRGVGNADHCLKQMLDWLEAHPAVKANTDVIVTADHGFATISRREIARDGRQTGQVSAALQYELAGKEKVQTPGTLPTGFLAVDLAVRAHLRIFDPAVRAAAGSSVFAELAVGGERSQHPLTGSALLGDEVRRLDGGDAAVIVASNGGSDLLYVPDHKAATVHRMLAVLADLDYVGGVFVDDAFCAAAADCPGALPMSAIGLVGSSKVPRPAIAVTFKTWDQMPGELQSAIQISDTNLQQGQGMHGGFGRGQTFNNMAAMGPDFKRGFADTLPMGNIDLVPTLARILGLAMPSVGSVKGRVLQEALVGGAVSAADGGKVMVSPAAANGASTVLEYQEYEGARYADRACVVAEGRPKRCESAR